jgi:hypothetical protein
MKYISILFLLFSYLHASNLLTYNIYERSDRVDLMLSFDAPYEGRIFQKRGENITTLTLNDLSYDKLIEKNINSTILQAISIEPDKDSIKVTIKSDKNIAVIASKTVDGFGLRVRAKPISLTQMDTPKTTPTKVEENNLNSMLGENTEDIVDGRYISVVAILFVMLLFMLWIKRRVTNQSSALQKKSNSWLFNKSNTSQFSKEVTLLHKKAIDQQNSVVLIEFEGRKYLVMTGSSNLLLEKFAQDDIQDDNDFEKAFEENRKKLDDYLRLQDSGIDKYKSKASGDFYPHLEND